MRLSINKRFGKTLVRAPVAALAIAAMGLATGRAVGSEITLASPSGSPARVVVPSENPLLQRTGQWMCNFLARRGYKASASPVRTYPSGSGCVVALETMDDAAIARARGVSVEPLRKARADAYLLTAGQGPEGPFVSIVGRNVQGVRSGVARIVAIIDESSGEARVRETSETRIPFFPIRRLHVCPTGRIAQDNAWCREQGLPPSSKRWADTLWTSWSDTRLREYAEQLWLMGFNSVEIAEIRGYRGVFSDEDLRRSITPKIRVFARALRDNGLQVSQFIWGQSLFVEGQSLCWNEPKERTVMLREFRRLAETYGDLVDHIVVHVGDPGGCDRNGCDPYKTTQEIATALQQAYRKVNPAVTATLSTWANEGFWKGRPGDEFLDTSHSPDSIGIALHRWYDPEKARTVLEAGRPLDIWGWYLSDFELSLDSHLLMRRLDKYFTMLPEQASQQVRAVSTELNFSGWPQIINAYVSAQKMWEPGRDLGEIEREFCAGVFGDANTEAMVRVYQACEAYVHPENYYGFIPPTDALPVVFGTRACNEQIRNALGALRTVKIDRNRSSRITSATPPQALLSFLSRNLRLVGIYSDAREKLDADILAGKPLSELQQAVAWAETQAAPYRMDPDYSRLSSDLKGRLNARR